MKNLYQFSIDQSKSIVIIVPQRKINWYYLPTTKLHKFDEVEVFFRENDKNFPLTQDIIFEVVTYEDFLEQCNPRFTMEIPKKLQKHG